MAFHRLMKVYMIKGDTRDELDMIFRRISTILARGLFKSICRTEPFIVFGESCVWDGKESACNNLSRH